MTECPIDAYKNFQTLSGPLTELILKPISVNQSPFIGSFSPRVVAPKLQKSGVIEESMGNSIQINNVRYDIYPVVFLSKPIHTGYILPDQQSAQLDMVAELIILTKNNNKSLFLCLPVYRTQNTSSYSVYLEQLWNTNAPVANLQTLFIANDGDNNQVSLNYVYCNEGESVDVFVFPRGISIPSGNWQKIMNIVEKLADLKISTGTVLSSSNDFRTRFQYYRKGVGLVGKFNASTCPAYKTNQYKCVPFDKINNLEGDTVVFKGAGTLQDRLREQDLAKQTAMAKIEGEKPGLSPTAIAAIVAGTLIGSLGIIYIGSKAAQFINQDN